MPEAVDIQLPEEHCPYTCTDSNCISCDQTWAEQMIAIFPPTPEEIEHFNLAAPFFHPCDEASRRAEAEALRLSADRSIDPLF